MVFEAHLLRAKMVLCAEFPSRSALTLPLGDGERCANIKEAARRKHVHGAQGRETGHLSGLRYLASGLQWEK